MQAKALISGWMHNFTFEGVGSLGGGGGGGRKEDQKLPGTYYFSKLKLYACYR